jgi:hypothetical protein
MLSVPYSEGRKIPTDGLIRPLSASGRSPEHAQQVSESEGYRFAKCDGNYFTTEDDFKTATWLIGDYDLGNNIFITTSNILVKFEF